MNANADTNRTEFAKNQFQQDRSLDSMLQKLVQSESDGHEFAERLKATIENTDCQYYSVDGCDTDSEFENTNTTRVSSLQILVTAALLLIGITVWSLAALKSPLPEVASNAKPSSQNHNDPANHNTPRPEQFDENFVQPVTGNDGNQEKDAVRDVEPVINPANDNSDCDRSVASKNQNQDVNVVETPPEVIPQSEVLADRPSGLGNYKNLHLKEQLDESFPPTRSLEITVEFNGSGYGRVSVNGEITAKRNGPTDIANSLNKIEPEICQRIGFLGPRIGVVCGNVNLVTKNSSRQYSFDSIRQFKLAIDSVCRNIRKVKSNYKRRRRSENPVDRCLVETVRKTNQLFQSWAQDSIDMGGSGFRVQRDAAEKYSRFIDAKSFEQFAKTGHFEMPKPDELYLPITTIQNLRPNQLKKELAANTRKVNLFRDEKEFQSFRESMVNLSANGKGGMATNNKSLEPLSDMLKDRPDLGGLPLVMGRECHLNEKRSMSLDQVSRTIGPVLARFDSFSSRNVKQHPQLRRSMISSQIASIKQLLSHSEIDPQKLLTIDQMLQVEQPEVRLELVSLLGNLMSQVSANLLACYAKFDLEPSVRMAATKALSSFPSEMYRNTLLEGFIYPWPAAAQHTAEALVRLNDIDSLPRLVALLESPDPRSRQKDLDGHFVSRELVAINHLKNCMLCHADSRSTKDRGRAPIPEWDKPLPRMYYNAPPQGFVARADVTYLRQDFSIIHFVSHGGPWPKNQRFDYVVQKRKLSEPAIEQPSKSNVVEPEKSDSHQYRDSILFALRMLTDKSPEDNSADSWREIVSETNSF